MFLIHRQVFACLQSDMELKVLGFSDPPPYQRPSRNLFGLRHKNLLTASLAMNLTPMLRGEPVLISIIFIRDQEQDRNFQVNIKKEI